MSIDLRIPGGRYDLPTVQTHEEYMGRMSELTKQMEAAGMAVDQGQPPAASAPKPEQAVAAPPPPAPPAPAPAAPSQQEAPAAAEGTQEEKTPRQRLEELKKFSNDDLSNLSADIRDLIALVEENMDGKETGLQQKLDEAVAENKRLLDENASLKAKLEKIGELFKR